jgi:hypothetical protein
VVINRIPQLLLREAALAVTRAWQLHPRLACEVKATRAAGTCQVIPLLGHGGAPVAVGPPLRLSASDSSGHQRPCRRRRPDHAARLR